MMMMTIESFLRDLDKHAAEFNFPVLDNAYVQMAAVRMSAFKSPSSWIIAFEVLGYSENEGTFVDDLYGYGSCIEREGIISSKNVMSQVREQPLIDPFSEAWIADWADWAIKVKNRVYRFTPTRPEYLAAGLEVPASSGPGSLTEATLMRYFVAAKGPSELFMSETELKEHFETCKDIKLFLQTETWEHPDIAGDERPSQSRSLLSLVEALAIGEPSLFTTGAVNTEWRRWEANDD